MLDGMDRLLRAMVDHGRMKISGKYDPCYRIVKS
ncbi:MAG: pyrimidine/purine nucleotide monophosphate nucleosidase domain-containing protein [Pseudomonadota bacterium]|nr:pyrimidine/purine nucleotide monophosphate nucleosidase domain-containing protein [Pseudomonadota bacterium]